MLTSNNPKAENFGCMNVSRMEKNVAPTTFMPGIKTVGANQENINFAYQCLGMLGVCLMRLNDCSKHF